MYIKMEVSLVGMLSCYHCYFCLFIYRNCELIELYHQYNFHQHFCNVFRNQLTLNNLYNLFFMSYIEI